MTINAIIKEMQDVPVDRLDEVFQFVHTLNPKTNSTSTLRKKILSFAGVFSDMKSSAYSDFIKMTKKTRAELFNRHTER